MFCKMWVYINFWFLKTLQKKCNFLKWIKNDTFLFEFLYKMFIWKHFRFKIFKIFTKSVKNAKTVNSLRIFGHFWSILTFLTFFKIFSKNFKMFFSRKKRFLCYFIIFLKPAWNRVFLGGAGRHFFNIVQVKNIFFQKFQKMNFFEIFCLWY